MDHKMVDLANGGFSALGNLFPPPDTNSPVQSPLEFPQQAFIHSISNEITIQQPITNGGMEIIALRLAGHARTAARLRSQLNTQDIIYNVRQSYFNALKAREMIDVAQQAHSFSLRNFEKAKIRFETGAVPVTDVLQWEAEAAKKESDLLQARVLAQISLLALQQTIGITTDNADDSLRLQPFALFKSRYQQGPALFSGSVSASPQAQTITSATAIARETRNLAIAHYFPKVNFFGSYTSPLGWYDKREEFARIEERRGWTAGVNASVPVFSGFKSSTALRKASCEYAKAREDEQNTLSMIELNRRRTTMLYQAAFEQVKAADKAMELMERQLSIMQQRYDGGLVNQSQLLEVSLGLSQARIGYISTLLDCLLLEAECHKSTGTLEVFHE
jgi:outer membrane protein